MQKTLPRLYCQNVIQFNSIHVNVISYKPAFPAPIFTKISNAQQRDVQISYTEFQLNWTINVESTDRNFYKPLSKIRFSLFWFSRKIHSIHKILWVSLVPLFFKLDQNVEYVERFSITSLKMYASYCTMKLENFPMALGEDILYRISSTSQEKMESKGRKFIHVLT
jgi:hypothetical protein